ncbi:helix-turn-helix domain-containing protein [Acidisoma silvae]|uniref:Helix-turn-helix transcriptional regulator n=1 Tax=Acidisoma silvae TaxID=2802396 RepID=A0A963YUV2_9PROT|nr:helix-turn-helix domain-containing protein [Acidisoma silvae]MCB8877444.1 helix-turn-helix transcriptional regulator [Acidisoma silvae]
MDVVNRARWRAEPQSDRAPPKPAEDKPTRPQPIRDAILRFMSEPRSAGEIAEHIVRPVPTATGHLRAMMQRGLVRRIAFGTYALSEYAGPDVRIPQRRSQSTREMRSTIRAHLCDRCSVQGLHLRTGISEKAVRVALRDLWFSGLLEGDETTGYRLVKHLRQS